MVLCVEMGERKHRCRYPPEEEFAWVSELVGVLLLHSLFI